MSSPPAGTVTFLFTDIEGSTRLWEQYPEAMRTALARHDTILRDAVESQQGRIVKTTGDGLHAVFANAYDGVAAVVLAQRALAAQDWRAVGSLRVRMALHSGSAEQRGGDYYGSALNRAARLMSAGHGGQILLSRSTTDLVQDLLPRDVSLRDLGEHRLKDLIRPEHVYQLLVADLPGEFPPLNSLNAFPNNLPLQLTGFIGRERELAEVKQLFAKTRLLTLTGPGGTGKTRLALQCAVDILADSAAGSECEFRDGAWLVELAPLADPTLVSQDIASVLGVREFPGRPLLDILVDHLRNKHLLLLLDNCEHLIGECARLAQTFLQACPWLKILASSREALGIAGETTYRVPPMTGPDLRLAVNGSPEWVATLAKYDAVHLFVERARAVQPKFELADHNALIVAQICARLDGIPLAIELASARLSLFSVEEIAARLDDRFRLLTGGSRAALPRQQTLRALVDWSYDLLADPERRLLRRLSVFVGGWTFAQAEQICVDGDLAGFRLSDTNGKTLLDAAVMLDVLAMLINKSLVIAEPQGSESRYRLLETIRQYARERLLESGESQPMRDRHLQFFTEMATSAEPELQGPRESEWSARLEVELDNIRAALDWSLDNQPFKSLKLLGSLVLFWGFRGYMTEGRRWSEQALARTESPSSSEDKADRAQVFASVAGFALGQGDVRTQYQAGAESIRLYRELGSPPATARALGLWAIAAMILGEVAPVQVSVAEGLALAHDSGNLFNQSLLQVVSAVLAAITGNADAMRAHATESVALARQTGSRYSLVMSLGPLSAAAMQVGDYTSARLWLEEAQALSTQMGNRFHVNHARGELANLARLTGDFARAVELYRESLQVWQDLGQLGGVARSLECLGFIAGSQGQTERAARLFGAAESLRERWHLPMEPQEQAELAQQLEQIQRGSDQALIEQARQLGRSLNLEQAIAAALADV